MRPRAVSPIRFVSFRKALCCRVFSQWSIVCELWIWCKSPLTDFDWYFFCVLDFVSFARLLKVGTIGAQP